MGGFLHPYSGQEAVAVGTISLLGDNDHVITAYRDHGHALAVGMDMKACMAELFGKATGCSKGKGGSMHFFAPEKNYWGGHGIVGGQTPLGLGLAFGLKYKGLRGCCLCYLGDGAVNQGTFHESLNLAALFKLPVIYIIENNGYSMGTSQQRSSTFRETLAKRAEGYDMAWDVFKGEDLYEVRAKKQIPTDRAHNDSEPTLPKFKPIVITDIPWPMPTPRNIGHQKRSSSIKRITTLFDYGAGALWRRESSPKPRLKTLMWKPKKRPMRRSDSPKKAHSRGRGKSCAMFTGRLITRLTSKSTAATSSTLEP